MRSDTTAAPAGPAEHEPEEAKGYLKPLVFEIGRDAPYQLTLTGAMVPPSPADVPLAESGRDASALIHPPSPREIDRLSNWEQWSFVGFLVFGTGMVVLLISDVRRWGVTSWEWLRRPKQRWDAIGGRILAVLSVPGLIGGVWFWIWWEHRRKPFGEPFEWFQGISVWPSTIIRFIALAVSVVFICVVARDLRRVPEEVLGPVCEPPPKTPRGERIRRALREWWSWFRGEKPETQTMELERRDPKSTCWSMSCRDVMFLQALVWTAILMVAAITFLHFFDAVPPNPARDSTAWWISTIALFSSGIAAVFLAFLVVAAVEGCRRAIKELGTWPFAWPRTARAKLCDARPEGPEGVVEPLGADEWASIRFIALQTNSVGKLLYYPAAALLLLVIARHPAFDVWVVNLPLLILIVFVFLIPVVVYWGLRNETRKTRDRILNRMRLKLVESLGEKKPEREKPGEKDSSGNEQLKEVIAAIERENVGAFQPAANDYIFRALAVVFGGGSVIWLVQFLPQVWQ